MDTYFCGKEVKEVKDYGSFEISNMIDDSQSWLEQ